MPPISNASILVRKTVALLRGRLRVSRRHFLKGSGLALAASALSSLAKHASALPSAAAITRPNIISRAAWGAIEAYRFKAGTEVWPPSYAPVRKIVLHHTGTGTGGSDPAAIVRSIYSYHAVELGWGDIGYHYLIDHQGNIYEGRFGGEGVIGSHAAHFNLGTIGIALIGTFDTVPPPPKMEAALIELLAWLSFHFGISPTGSGPHLGLDTPNILAHADINHTNCPGLLVLPRLPEVRRAVAARIAPPDYAVAWVSHAPLATLSLGQRATIALTLRNIGARPWDPIAGKYAFRLGYHWYDAQGRPVQQPAEEDVRTSLPKVVAPGEEVALTAAVVAPKEPGRYTLEWDMVHEGHTWFAKAGAQPLRLAVTVSTGRRYDASWLHHATPSVMALGQRRHVSIVLRNVGSTSWDPIAGKYAFRLGYHWYDAQGRPVQQPAEEDVRTSLPKVVAPGEEVALTAAVVAPKEPGRYTLEWDMVHEGHTWFAKAGAQPLSVAVTVKSVQYGVAWLRHTTPSRLSPGQRVTAEVAAQNVGLLTWTPGNSRGAFRLGYHWYDAQGKEIPLSPADDLRTALPATVPPGSAITLQAALVAPRTPGRYTLAWDMVHEGYTWFADEPANAPLLVTIEVA